MATDDGLASLQETLRATRRLLDEARARARAEQASAPLVLEALNQEKRRSERYNHYFSLAMLRSQKLTAVDLLRTAAGVFRGSDLVGVVDAGGRLHLLGCGGRTLESILSFAADHGDVSVAAVLPETDRGAAGCALRRFEGMLTTDDGVGIGLAVYPDDSTDVEELLRMAAG